MRISASFQFVRVLAFCLISLGAFSQSFSAKSEKVHVEFNYVKEKTKGTISNVKVDLEIDFSAISKSKVTGVAMVHSLTTGNKLRDKHLKSKDFFNAEVYPEMRFEAKTFYEKDGAYFTKGNLTIKDITKQVTFKIERIENGLKFSSTIFAHDFDVAIKKDRSKSEVEIEVFVSFD